MKQRLNGDLRADRILHPELRDDVPCFAHPFHFSTKVLSLQIVLYLELNDIEHRRTRVRKPQTNGFVERFNRTVLDEFFRTAFRTKFYESVEALQSDLDAWLTYYNNERPHQGYRNRGKRPTDTINEYLTNVKREG